jgi:ATP-dependent Lon protease
VGRLLHMPDGSHSALVQGRRRVEIVEFIRVKPYIRKCARASFHEPTNCR